MPTITKTKNFAVLTGDIINSSKLKVIQRKSLLDALTELLDTYKTKTKNNLKIKAAFEIFRGDSFQIQLDSPEQSLRMALLVRTFLQCKIVVGNRQIPADARIAIGVGTVNAPANTLAESDGEAFRFSGRLLDTLKKQPNQLAFKSRKPTLDAELNTSLVLLESIMNRWTVLQSEVIYYKLQGYTEVVIAEILKIKQPAVNQRAKAASWLAIERLLLRYQDLLTP